ncbi:MAG: PQQ-binding-like beta-propeller repeat protein [Planctomycetota bacterium]
MKPVNQSCLATLLLAIAYFCATSADAEDWPQWRGPGRDAKLNDPTLPRQVDAESIARKWAVEIGPGYSAPTVADGRVYVTDRQGEAPNVTERVLCFDAENGELIWKHENPVQYRIGYQASGPRASVTIDHGLAFSVGGMGRMNCLDAASGELKWSRDLNADYEIRMPAWGITCAPLVYQDLVLQIVGGSGKACVVAFEKDTGKERWRALNERAGYSAPILIRQGDQDVAVCWTGESVTGLNPRTGDVFWSIEMLPRKMPIGVPTPVVDGDKLFVSSFYDGSLLIRLDLDKPDATSSWRRVGVDEINTDGLHAMISNPIIKGDAIYGADSYGQFRCLEIASGDRVWEDLSVVRKARWATVHIIQNGEDEIMLNEQGELLFTTLSRDGVEIRSRSKLVDPTLRQLRRRSGVVWAAPAIADGCIYARNDEELLCAPLRGL